MNPSAKAFLTAGAKEIDFLTGFRKRRWPHLAAAVLLLLPQAITPESSAATRPGQSAAAAAPPIPAKPLPVPTLGTAWYPEQWPEAQWEADLRRMEQAHIHLVRVGEFAWSALEPTEGDYHLDWLERAIDAAGRHDIRVVLGTPTATPPAWLTTRYPEVLRVNERGVRMQHGDRQQANWANATYLQFSRGIVRVLAQRFGHNRNVIGWQIDNEISQTSADADTEAQFQDWLRSRYVTLDALNRRWAAAYWSQSYTDWRQIRIPRSAGVDAGNPGLLLSWRSFITNRWVRYVRNQVRVLRPLCDPRMVFTTNTMGFFQYFDHYPVLAELDIASWDDYFANGKVDPVSNGAANDLTRGFKRKNFWVMKTQPGFVNWSGENVSLPPGATRAVAWHDVGHGADMIGYWQWRSARNGQEQYHGTVVGPDGQPDPIYSEIAQTGAEMDRLSPMLAGTSIHSQVAVLHSYESRWAIEWQPHSNRFDPVAELVRWYGALRNETHAVDVISPSANLSGYKLLVAPALNLLTRAEADNLLRYVQGGGHLLLGPRSAMKDDDNAFYPERQPGPLRSLLGGYVEQFYAIHDPVPVDGMAGHAEASVWAETLQPTAPDAVVALRYGEGNGWLTGKPAMLTRAVGAGSIGYLGAVLDYDGTVALSRAWLHQAGVAADAITAPAGVEVSVRDDGERRIHIMVNFSQESQTITLPSTMRELLAGTTARTIRLAPFGVAVLVPDAAFASGSASRLDANASLQDVGLAVPEAVR